MEKHVQLTVLARLEALETLQAHLLSAAYYDAKLTIEQVEAAHEGVLKKFAERTFPGVDPAIADHYAAEVQESIERTLLRAVETLKAAGQ